MRKILFALFTVLLASCSQITEKSIEDKATDQLKKTMKEVLNNPDDATLTGVRTEYQSDSLCVIEFTLKAKNGEGKMISQSMEYLFIDLEKMSIPEHGQLEGFYYIGLPGSVMYGLELLREEDSLKEFKEQGFDPEYVLSNTVFNVRDKYSDELIKYANHSPSHPRINDKLIFSASWLKVMMNGRQVNKDSKEIKL